MNLYGWHTLITPFHLNDKLPPQAQGAQFHRTLKKWGSMFMATWIKCRRKRTDITILMSAAAWSRSKEWPSVQLGPVSTHCDSNLQKQIKKNVCTFDVLYWFETWLLSVKEEFWPYRVREVLKWRRNKQMERFYVYGSVYRWSILIIVQRVATQSSLFIIL